MRAAPTRSHAGSQVKSRRSSAHCLLCLAKLSVHVMMLANAAYLLKSEGFNL